MATPWQETLAQALGWSEAHPTLEAATADVPPPLRGVRLDGFPHSLWELVEHLRRAQADVLDLVANPDYVAPVFPDDYWPHAAAPPSEEAWDACLAALLADRGRLEALARGPSPALLGPTPSSPELTPFGLVLQILDHTAYHLGQIVMVRRLLGIWPEA